MVEQLPDPPLAEVQVAEQEGLLEAGNGRNKPATTNKHELRTPSTDTSNSLAVDSEAETSRHRRQKSDSQSTCSTECSN